MAQYLLVFHCRITDSEGAAEESIEMTVNCEPKELQKRIAEKKERIKSKLENMLESNEDGFVVLKQVLPL